MLSCSFADYESTRQRDNESTRQRVAAAFFTELRKSLNRLVEVCIEGMESIESIERYFLGLQVNETTRLLVLSFCFFDCFFIDYFL